MKEIYPQGSVCLAPSASAFPLLHVEASNKSIQPRFNLLDVQTPPWTPELAQVHVTDPASPPCPPKQRSKCKFLQSEDIFVKQLVAVCRVCVCADAAKNDYLTLRNHCVQGVRGNVPIFQKLWRIRSQANHF